MVRDMPVKTLEIGPDDHASVAAGDIEPVRYHYVINPAWLPGKLPVEALLIGALLVGGYGVAAWRLLG